MDEDDSLLKIKVSLGFIVAADDLEAARALVRAVNAFCERTPGLRLVHKDLTVDRLWLKRGPGP